MGFVLLSRLSAFGEVPAPSLESVYPTGGTAGIQFPIEISGKALTGVWRLHSSMPGFRFALKEATRGEVTIPEGTLPGIYDVWAVSDTGVSSPRSFAVSHRPELVEFGENDSPVQAIAASLNSVINGRIEQPGDQDHFRFEARQGQLVILECWAERIDSRLRAVLEVFDAEGRRLAVNRGYHGIDPLIEFRVPADGLYVVKIHDLVYSGGLEHSYRLEVDAGPRVAFTVPNVIPRGQSSRVQVFGWNLSFEAGELNCIEVEIPAAEARDVWPLPFRIASHQAMAQGFPYHHPGSDTTVLIGLSDGPVTLDRDDNHGPATAQRISVPCDISGRLVDGNERDWFSFEALRGEVFCFDVLSQRLGAPTDLQLGVWNAGGEELIAEWNDESKNIGGISFPTNHLDPAGRWVAPANGRYLVMIRNLRGGLQSDPRRSYRISIRREEPEMQVVAIPRSTVPVGFTLHKGGRFAFDVLAFRQRGLQDEIRVSASNLPAGIECPDIVLGPGVDRGTMVISAEPSAENPMLSLALEAEAAAVGKRPVRGSTVIRAGTPNGWSRLTSEIPLAVTGDAPLRITAAIQDQLDHHLYGKLKLRYSPGSVLDVAVSMEQRDPNHRPAVKLAGVGLPPAIAQQTSIIPAGARFGTISFLLPPTLATGRYSLAISAETTVALPGGKSEAATVVSNPVTFSVEPAAFEVAIDPFTPTRVKRGETFQVNYTAVRTNGFIGKIHTELACPGIVTDVPGLRGRGVTFVGQSEQGAIQIVVNDSASVGKQPFIRLFGVGVVEDQPMSFGAAWLPLEITD